jgi:predicted dehydrogenase
MMAKGVIVGAGRAGTHLHYGALKASGAEIAGFVEGNPELLADTTKRFGLSQGFASLDEAFAKCGRLDFVDICSSTKSHFPLAKAALEKGSHVLIEKPITENLEELEALREISKGTDLTICAVHNHKYYPGVEDLRRRLASGEAGDVLFVHREMSFIHDRVRMMEPNHWAHQLPGGRLFEANPHNLYLLYGLLGEMELVDISSRKVSTRWPHAKIDEFTATLKSRSAHASIHMSLNGEATENAKHGPNFILAVGTKKTLYADYQRVVDMGTFEVTKPGSVGLLQRVRNRALATNLEDASGQAINVGKGSGHYWILDRFIGFISGRYQEEPVPFDEAFYVQRMNLEMGNRVEGTISSLIPV